MLPWYSYGCKSYRGGLTILGVKRSLLPNYKPIQSRYHDCLLDSRYCVRVLVRVTGLNNSLVKFQCLELRTF